MKDLERYCAHPIPAPSGEEAPFSDACENGEPIIDITQADPRIRYAASYYKNGVPGALTHCYVRQGVYERLLGVLKQLPEEYGLLIYDTLRPLRVQKALFDEYYARLAAQHRDLSREALEEMTSEFVARPVRNVLRPSNHQSGGAVDLTITKGGVPLDMGTVFDEFAPIAHADYFEQPGRDRTIRDHRRLLHFLMREQGFTHYESEWWHFDYGDRMWARANHTVPLYAYCADGDCK